MTNLANRLALRGLAIAALVGFAAVAKAEVVANLGVLSVGATELVTCNTAPNCTTTTGSAGGQLPTNTAGADPFTHQIVFQVAVASNTISSTQVLNSSTIDVANMTVSLFEVTGGSTAVGGTATHGAVALATTPGAPGVGTTFQFFIQFAGLDPAKTYLIELLGGGQGVQSEAASYSQQISIVPPAIPLPPALLLFAAALAGLIGFARMRRKSAAT